MTSGTTTWVVPLEDMLIAKRLFAHPLYIDAVLLNLNLQVAASHADSVGCMRHVAAVELQYVREVLLLECHLGALKIHGVTSTLEINDLGHGVSCGKFAEPGNLRSNKPDSVRCYNFNLQVIRVLEKHGVAVSPVCLTVIGVIEYVNTASLQFTGDVIHLPPRTCLKC